MTGLSYTWKIINGVNETLTEMKFDVDDEMACTLFKSCMKTSMIA